MTNARNTNMSLADAVSTLDDLRQACGLSTYGLSGKTREELINEILLGRRRELWEEGFSLTDILRLRRAVERKSYQGNPVLCRQIPGGELKECAP